MIAEGTPSRQPPVLTRPETDHDQKNDADYFGNRQGQSETEGAFTCYGNRKTQLPRINSGIYVHVCVEGPFEAVMVSKDSGGR